MGCFVVPLVQAIATTVYRRVSKKSGRTPGLLGREIPALEKMLWGGSLMLIVDHIINGEITWKFPFFTALMQDGGGNVLLREMLTVGVPMSLVLTAAWMIYALVKGKRSVQYETK